VLGLVLVVTVLELVGSPWAIASVLHR